MASEQWLYIIRHGDRWDYENPEWSKTTTRPGDPPLSMLGHQQARETGVFLDGLFSRTSMTLDKLTFLSSPFLRTIQTSNDIIDGLVNTSSITEGISLNEVKILPEYSVFEWDGKGGEWHASLPPIEERPHYFPRVDASHESLFVPTIPEPRDKFHDRCTKAAEALSTSYDYVPNTAIVVVSHAAGCIGLCSAFASKEISDITPAAPCSVYRLSRISKTNEWSIDDHDKLGGLNGHTSHMSTLGSNTVPWNNFGDKSSNKGYTGPPTSRFAPKTDHPEL